MKDYAAMSDFEINEAVGKFVYLPHLCVSNGVCLYAKDDMWTEFDPCNNPADAWPIIVEYGIGIIPYKNGLAEAWNVSRGLIEGTTKDKNPLRCAMIVFLMMKDGE